MTKRLARSSTVAPGGAGVRSAGPTAAMRLPSTTMTASRSGVAATPSNRVPQRIARMLRACLRATSIRGRPSRAAPDLAGGLGDQGQLGFLIRRAEEVPLLGRCEAALRAQRESLEWDE